MKITKNSASALIIAGMLLAGCAKSTAPTASKESQHSVSMAPIVEEKANEPKLDITAAAQPIDNFEYIADQFADLRVLRYQVPGFEKLEPQQKEMLYYLYEAALCGRDMIYDQNYKHNLRIRRTLDAIVENYAGDRNNPEFQKFMTYTKRFWFSNGIHHHYSTNKMFPEFSQAYFAELVKNSPNAKFPLNAKESKDAFVKWITPILFDPKVAPKKVNQTKDQDLIATSATNFYEGVTQKEVEAFYAKKEGKNSAQPLSYGINSKLVKENGVIKEKVWKVGGMYDASISKIVMWLEKALAVATDEAQKKSLSLRIHYIIQGY